MYGSNDKNISKSSATFVVELLVLFSILMFITVVVTQALITARARSLESRHLTEAVITAENTMEALLAAEADPESDGHVISDNGAWMKVLEGMDNVSEAEAVDGGVRFVAAFTGQGGSGESYQVSAAEASVSGGLTEYEVSVSLKDEKDVIYTLKTGKYDWRRQ